MNSGILFLVTFSPSHSYEVVGSFWLLIGIGFGVYHRYLCSVPEAPRPFLPSLTLVLVSLTFFL